MTGSVTAEDWIKGIALSIMASMIGGASKLAIRKSWLMELQPPAADEDDQASSSSSQYDAFCENESRGNSTPYSQFQDGGASSNSSSVNGDAAPTEQQQQEEPRSLAVAYLLRFSGMIGMTFLNPLCCVLAMNYASPSILAPFSGLTLVWIVLFSNPVVGEKPSQAQVIAASLIVVGEVIVAFFGDHKNDEDVTLTELRDSYLDPLFLWYFVLITLWMLGLWYEMKCDRSALRKRFAWGVSGGSITGLQNFLKDSLTILKATKASHATHFPWYLYLMVFLAIATAFGGLLLLTACMKRYDATYSSAMFVGSFVVSASIMSAVHYSTFANLEHVWNHVLYPLGLIVLMMGVVILVKETEQSTRDEAESSPSSERVAELRDPSTRQVELKEPLVQIVTKPGSEGDLAW